VVLTTFNTIVPTTSIAPNGQLVTINITSVVVATADDNSTSSDSQTVPPSVYPGFSTATTVSLGRTLAVVALFVILLVN